MESGVDRSDAPRVNSGFRGTESSINAGNPEIEIFAPEAGQDSASLGVQVHIVAVLLDIGLAGLGCKKTTDCQILA